MSAWKQLFAAVAGVGLSAVAAVAQPPRPGPSSLEAEGFRGAIFATPGSGREVVPAAAEDSPPRFLPDVLPFGGAEAAEGPPATNAPAAPSVATRVEELLIGPGSLSPRWRVWAGAEVLLGTGRPVSVPPVVTTGPASDGLLTAGALGQPNTVPLFGGRKMLGDWRGGLRTEVGFWFDPRHTTGVAGRFYSLYSTSDQLVGAGNGLNVVNLPQLVSVNGAVVQFPIYVGFPGVTTGTVSTTAQTMFAGGDLSLRSVMRQGPRWRLDALFGYRQLYLRDELGADFTVVGTPAIPGLGAAAATGGDNVRTRNHFFGPQFGTVGSVVRGRWLWQGLAAVGLGANVSELDFDRTRVVTAGAVGTVPLAPAFVRSSTTYFGVVAEGGLKLAYRVTDRTRLTFGYTYLSWWNVRRAPEQFTIGPTLTGDTTHYHAHMLSWGAEFRY